MTIWQKQNSGCTWTQEDGDDTTGSWSGSGVAVGSIRFSEDGTYGIDIRADTAGPDGVLPEEPKLPHRNWETITDLSANCEGEGWDRTDTGPPIVQWASSYLGAPDVNGFYAYIEGLLDVGDSGSVVAGSLTWEMSFPEDFELRTEWHLEHDGPITLPHS